MGAVVRRGAGAEGRASDGGLGEERARRGRAPRGATATAAREAIVVRGAAVDRGSALGGRQVAEVEEDGFRVARRRARVSLMMCAMTQISPG